MGRPMRYIGKKVLPAGRGDVGYPTDIEPQMVVDLDPTKALALLRNKDPRWATATREEYQAEGIPLPEEEL